MRSKNHPTNRQHRENPKVRVAFQKEYILARGFPVFVQPMKGANYSGYQAVAIAKSLLRVEFFAFKMPKELAYHRLPKFELVLRKIEPDPEIPTAEEDDKTPDTSAIPNI